MAGPIRLLHRRIVAAHHDVLRRADDRRPVRRAENVVGRHHQRGGFHLSFDRQRQVDGHLVAVEVGVEPLADQRVNANGVAFHQDRLEGLNAHAVQRRSAVQKHRVIGDHLFQNVPHFLVAAFEHPLGRLDGVGMAEFLEPADDERLIEFQRDLLGQPALMQVQVGSDDDHGTGRVIDALAEQVLAEAALLALDHVGQRLEGAVGRAEHRTFAAVVVEQRVDRLLQHPLLVADDDFRRVQIHQLFEPVVAVDDPAVQVVQIAGGEVPGIQQHQRTQVRRDDRHAIQDHPFRFVVAVAEAFRHFQPLNEILLLLLARRLFQLFAELDRQLDEVHPRQQLLDGFGPHVGGERFLAVLALRLPEFLLRQHLAFAERRITGIGDGVVLEVDHLFQRRGLHVEQRAQAARHRLEEPDVHDGRGELDVAHPLAADPAVRDLDAATVADHALVLHPAVLAAGAFPVLFRSEDALAEQAVAFRTVSAVVDRLGLFHLAERPTADVLRAGQSDFDGRVFVDAIVIGFADAHCALLWGSSGPASRPRAYNSSSQSHQPSETDRRSPCSFGFKQSAFAARHAA